MLDISFEDLREPEQMFDMRQGKVREKTLNQYMRKTLSALKKTEGGFDQVMEDNVPSIVKLFPNKFFI